MASPEQPASTPSAAPTGTGLLAGATPGAGVRWGMTVPFPGVSLHDHRSWYERLVGAGFDDIWSAEADGSDAFTPLALAAAWTPSLRLGTAIVPAFTRGPACLAQCVASLADAAPGRVAVGIGASSDVIVERWNDLRFERPLERVRDVVRFLRDALGGAKVNATYDTFTVRGFRLGVVPAVPPALLVAALRPGMLRVAGREADGAILNWLSADDVARVVPYVHEGGPGKEIVARIFVCPSTDTEAVRTVARYAIAAYLNVPVYAAFHRWLGRGDALADMHERWAAGDRKGALAAIPDAVVDELVVHGTPEACRAHLQAYVANGVTTPVVALLPSDVDPATAIASLAPGQP